MSTLEETLQCPQCGCMNIIGAAEAETRIAKLEAENERLREDMCGGCNDSYRELEAESAGRMRRIEKLVALCHEYDIPMDKVLDTGLREGE